MERIHQIINREGLQIPLSLIERYGLQSGADVVLELRDDGIHILPAMPAKEDIENLALQYLFRHLGDAVRVQVQAKEEQWHVAVLGADISNPLGSLVFSARGKHLPEQSSSVAEMRQTAVTLSLSK